MFYHPICIFYEFKGLFCRAHFLSSLTFHYTVRRKLLDSKVEGVFRKWVANNLGIKYVRFEEEVEGKRKKFRTDTGEIDILAISKDKSEYLVIELKKGRASDSVVGQIQRYMGYIKEEVADSNQKVKGLIIALEDDLRIRRALSVNTDIDFNRYKVEFDLIST